MLCWVFVVCFHHQPLDFLHQGSSLRRVPKSTPGRLVNRNLGAYENVVASPRLNWPSSILPCPPCSQTIRTNVPDGNSSVCKFGILIFVQQLLLSNLMVNEIDKNTVTVKWYPDSNASLGLIPAQGKFSFLICSGLWLYVETCRWFWRRNLWPISIVVVKFLQPLYEQ